MNKETIITALDIGTNKVCCIIYKLENENYNPIGFSEIVSKGFRKGVVIDLELLVLCIENAVRHAEEMAGFESQNIVLNITGEHLRSFNNKGVLKINEHSHVIKNKHIERVLYNVQQVKHDIGEELLQMITQDYIIDGEDGIYNPETMVGSKLEVKVHSILGKTNLIHNILNAVEKAGFIVSEIFINSCLSAQAVLSPEEKKLGVLVLDIGAGTSDLIIYKNNKVVFTCVILFGGEIVSKDIAEELHLSNEKAEEIKKKYGYVGDIVIGHEEKIEVSNITGTGFQKIFTKDLSCIMDKKADYILNEIKRIIKDSGFENKLSAGIVFTGGVSLTKGFIPKAKDFFNFPVRMGSVSLKIKNQKITFKGPQYSTSAGVGTIFSTLDSEKFNSMVHLNGFILLKEKIKKYFIDLF